MNPIFASMRLDDPDAPDFVRRWTGPADRLAAGDRPASLLARALAHSLVAADGVKPRMRIDKDARGKPHFVAPDGKAGPSVSLAHSASVAAAALCEGGALGIDVERHRARDFRELAAAAFGPAECAAVEGCGSDAFYRVWTLREAHAKATGCGLAQVLDRTDRFHAAPPENTWTMALDGSAWRFVTRRIDADYSLAVAHCAVAV
ncbi:MAG: 4'-phosphopantetheinyl transferase superfamily protein [Proteobacteria bacterium]|nr:4'-phosphopantetheinyl transferase superfamily protein [Pseudomonadota bacterium]